MDITQILLIVNLFVTVLVVALVLVWRREGAGDWKSDFSVFGAELNKIGPLMREELTRSREEGQRTSRETREELGSSVKAFTESLNQQFQTLLTQQGRQNADFATRLDTLVKTNGDKFEKLILANESQLAEFRDQLMASLKTHREEAGQAAKDSRTELSNALKSF